MSDVEAISATEIGGTMSGVQELVLKGFPSLAWLEALRDGMNSSLERYRKVGTADTRFVIRVEDEGCPTTDLGVVFNGYSCEEVVEVADSKAFEPDFIIRGSAEAWLEMLENIVRNGKADREHTINRLTLIRRPLEVLRSATMAEYEKFFQYNYTLQLFFDELGASEDIAPA